MTAKLSEMKKQLNPFGPTNNQVNQPMNAVSHQEQQRAMAEVQAAMMIARMNPRNQVQAMDRILNSCARSSLAEVAVYSYARGGSDISGPSIRLAEAIAQQWGNMQFGIREVEQRNGESTVQAFAWDIETNTRREMTFQVPHVRYTRANGSTPLNDPRDIYEVVANQGARRLRACILGVIPGDVVESAVSQCEITLKSTADTTPDGIKKILDALATFGVTKVQVEKKIQRRVESIHPAQVVALRKIYTSLRDGVGIPDQYFDQTDLSPVSAVDVSKKQKKEQQVTNPVANQIQEQATEPEQQHYSPGIYLADAINAASKGDFDLATDIAISLSEEEREAVENEIIFQKNKSQQSKHARNFE